MEFLKHPARIEIKLRQQSPATESSMELLNHPAKMGTYSRPASTSNFSQPMESTVKSIGRPTGKRFYTWRDVSTIVLSLVSFFLPVLTVVYAPFAASLGQKNQLIVIGFLLSLMAVCLQKQTQLLLITLEARFGASTLQNYDSILRDSILDANVSTLVNASLILLFALPLGLSASYKQFVSGTTEINMKPLVLEFGPAGPPGLVTLQMALTMNASLPIFQPLNVYNTSIGESKVTGSFGFNTGIISENMTTILDARISNNFTSLQASLKDGESLWISSYVNATICSLKPDPSSPEREDFDAYWTYHNKTLADAPSQTDNYTGQYFGMLSGYADWRTIYLSLWDPDHYPGSTFYTNAIEFNLYRGQCNATWQISRFGITLEDSSNCTSIPESIAKPCTGDNSVHTANFSHVTGPDLLQLPITCNIMDLGNRLVYPFYDLLYNQSTSPVMVASVASAVHAQIAATYGPAHWALRRPNDESGWYQNPKILFPFLKYPAPVTMSKTVRTL